jgi:hypothetical protein
MLAWQSMTAVQWMTWEVLQSTSCLQQMLLLHTDPPCCLPQPLTWPAVSCASLQVARTHTSSGRATLVLSAWLMASAPGLRMA